jgi:hypothetical protein
VRNFAECEVGFVGSRFIAATRHSAASVREEGVARGIKRPSLCMYFWLSVRLLPEF